MNKKLIVPFCGVILGTAALGNLLRTDFPALYFLCGLLAGAGQIYMTVKILLCKSQFKKAMEQPPVASVFGTYSMSFMLLAGYMVQISSGAALALWYIGVTIHICLIIWFTGVHFRKGIWKGVHASWYIIYVGIAASCFAAPALQTTYGAWYLFVFAVICAHILLPIVLYRYIKYPVPESAQPLFCIACAPFSLCLAAYVQTASTKSQGVLIYLLCLSLLFYVMVLIRLPKLLRLKFYPSFAAFTFPFVISASAAKMTFKALTAFGINIPGSGIIVTVQTVIAAALVIYAWVRYIMNFFSKAAE